MVSKLRMASLRDMSYWSSSCHIAAVAGNSGCVTFWNVFQGISRTLVVQVLSQQSMKSAGVVFSLDILLRFNTAYEPPRKQWEGDLVTNRWKIAGHYLCTSFLLDFLSIVPAYLEVRKRIDLLHIS